VLKKSLLAVALLILVLGIAAVVSVRLLLAPERVRAMVEAQASAALGQRVRVASAAARVWPEIGLELRDILIEGTATRLGSVSVATGLRPLFSRRVEDARVTMSDGTIEMPWLLALLASLSDAPQPPPGSRPPLTIVSVRAIELRGITLAAGRHRARIDADGVLQEDQLEVARLDATAEGTSLTASGTFTSISRAVGTFAIEAETLDLDALLALARSAPGLDAAPWAPPTVDRADRPRIAVAGGEAFTFSYAETVELLDAAGADVVVVDPLHDDALPPGTAGLVVGGGFPEVHAAALSANASLREDVRRLAASGAPVVGECAGLLYLCQELDGLPMCGVLPAHARMTSRLTLGYRTAGDVTGHEFHRTVVEPRAGATPAWLLDDGPEGFVQDGVHASYVHLHWAGAPERAAAFVDAAARQAVAA